MTEEEISSYFQGLDPSHFIESEEESTEDLRRNARVAVAVMLFRLAQKEELSSTDVGVMLFAVTGGNTRREVSQRWTNFCKTMLKFIHRPASADIGKSPDIQMHELYDQLYKDLYA